MPAERLLRGCFDGRGLVHAVMPSRWTQRTLSPSVLKVTGTGALPQPVRSSMSSSSSSSIVASRVIGVSGPSCSLAQTSVAKAFSSP